LSESIDLELILSAYNVSNSENALAVCEFITGCGDGIQTGDETLWQLPRRYELGVRITF
jgi:hypothetical protein